MKKLTLEEFNKLYKLAESYKEKIKMTETERVIIQILTVINACVVENLAISLYSSEKNKVKHNPWSDISMNVKKEYRDKALVLIKEIE